MYFGLYGLLPFLRFVCRSAECQGYELASMPALAYMGASLTINFKHDGHVLVVFVTAAFQLATPPNGTVASF